MTTGQLTTGQLRLGNQQLGNSDNWAIPTGPLRRLGTYKFIGVCVCEYRSNDCLRWLYVFFNQRMCIFTIGIKNLQVNGILVRDVREKESYAVATGTDCWASK